ncbi:MAG: GTPase [Acidimicrobiales bacterium]
MSELGWTSSPRSNTADPSGGDLRRYARYRQAGDVTPGIARIVDSEGPLRVAIAGKVKAGKSTLLNALVEGTTGPDRHRRVHPDRHLVSRRPHLSGHAPSERRLAAASSGSIDEGAIDVDLAGRSALDYDRIDVTWPSAGRHHDPIDTPGVGSLTEGVANRAFEFLDPTEAETQADAVLYLMKHIHASDLRLLEAFHDTAVSQPNVPLSVNAVWSVLSSADEIGAGRLDSMASARKIAKRYGDDGRLRRLIQVVVPVAGLLAETAETLTGEFKSLRALRGRCRRLTTRAVGDLLSADRFVEARPETPLTSLERQQLLDRLGLFGVRLSLALIRRNVGRDQRRSVDELVNRSGLTDLRGILSTLFMDRADVLKARSAMLAVERMCNDYPETGASDLLGAIEQIMAGAHRSTSSPPWRRCARAGCGAVRMTCSSRAAAWRPGPSPPSVWASTPLQRRIRFATPPWPHSAGGSEAENRAPLTSLDLVTASRVVIRTLEGLITDYS